MYESQTYETILERMLENALANNSNLDSREGSLLWYGQAPTAVEFQNLYIALDNILQESTATTASRDYLILIAKDRGLTPLDATYAVLKMAVKPKNLQLPLQTRFSIGNLNYYVSENMGDGFYAITCETAGAVGNKSNSTVLPIEYVEELETCEIVALLVPGEDEEDTEVFRQRYFDSMNAQAFGGNKADYLEKVNAIPGVGGVKVYRAWNGNISPSALKPPDGTEAWINSLTGISANLLTWLKAVFAAADQNLLTVGGTVKVVIMDSTFSVPSDVLVSEVQNTIDPVDQAGEGVGIAPIGHVVQVEGVGSERIDVSFTLSYSVGWTWEDVEDYVEAALTTYFTELAKDWANTTEPLVVRISQIESRLLGISGILDINGTAINGTAANHTLQLDYIPVLGMITEG